MFVFKGLLPNTVHKVTIKAKPSSQFKQIPQQQLSASIEFKTLSFGKKKKELNKLFILFEFFLQLDESIEPPKRVQVIAGPQSDTLLLSWNPHTTSTRGYRILVDGRKLQDVTNTLCMFPIFN